MNLLTQAKSFDPGKYTPRQVTEDEIELFLALLAEEVTSKQCVLALGRSTGYFYNWVRRCTRFLYEQRQLNIQRVGKPVLAWKARTYEDYKKIHESYAQQKV
jgi:hypothetical protein